MSLRIASIADVKARFSAFVKASETGPVVVTRNGRPVAAIVPIFDDDEVEDLLLSYSTRFKKILEKAHQQLEEGEGIPEDEFWQEADKK